MNIPEEGENKQSSAKLQGYAAVLSIGSTRCKANTLGLFNIDTICSDIFILSLDFFHSMALN